MREPVTANGGFSGRIVSVDSISQWTADSDNNRVSRTGAPSAFALGGDAAEKALMFLCVGQSNMVGYGVTPYTPTLSQCTFWGSDNAYHPLVDPWAANLNFGAFGTSFGGYGIGPRFAEALRAGGVTNPLIFVPCAWGGTASSTWAASLTNPPDNNTLCGRTKLRLEAARVAYPNAIMGGILCYQGESDTSSSLAIAQAHSANWTAIYNALFTYFATTPFVKGVRIWHVILPATEPLEGAPHPWWQDVRTAQIGMASSTLHVVQAPDEPGGHLHHDTGIDDTTGYRKLAVDLAANWLAAS